MVMGGASREVASEDVRVAGRALTLLREAIGTGEIVTIVYMAGSQPGTKRDVLPRSVSRDELRAHCLACNGYRSFKIAHLRVVEPGADYPTYDPARPRSKQKDASLDDVVARNRERLEVLGWSLVASEHAITLHAPADAGDLAASSVVVALGRHDKGSDQVSWVVQDASGKRRSRKLLGSAEKLFLAAADAALEDRARIATESAPARRQSSRLGSVWRIALWLVSAFVGGLAVGLFLP